MRLVQFTAVRVDTGAVLPHATATVVLTGTSTKVSLTDANGSEIDNPVTATADGLVAFVPSSDVTVDVIISSQSGSYSPPPIVGLQIVDLMALKDALSAEVTARTIGDGNEATRAELAEGALSSAIATLQSALAGKASSADLVALSGAVAAIQSGAATDHASIVALLAAKAGFDTHFSTVDGRLDNAEASAAAAVGHLATLDGRADALEASAGSAVQHIATLEGRADALEAGTAADHATIGTLTTAISDETTRAELTLAAEQFTRAGADVRLDGLRRTRSGPSAGFDVTTGEPITFARVGMDGRITALWTPSGPRIPLASGATETFLRTAGAQSIVRGYAVARSGPGAGFVPGTYEPVARARIANDNRALLLVSNRDQVWRPDSTGLFRADPATGKEPQSRSVAVATVMVGAAEVTIANRLIATPETTVTSAETATEAVSGEAVLGGAGRLSYLRYETIVALTQVRRASDGTVLPNATVQIDLSRGIVTNTIADALVIDYTGSKQRHDCVYVDPTTGLVGVAAGTEYASAAAVWGAAVPAGMVQIGRIYRTAGVAAYIPTWRWQDGVHIARRADDAAWLSYNRGALPVTLRRLRAGAALRVIGYGDSRMSIENNGDFADLNVHPNSAQAAGYYRDNAQYFLRYDAATRAQAGIEGPLDWADGWGALHCREGFMWWLLRQIAQHYGVSVGVQAETLNYRNWSLAGTNSGTGTVAGDSRANGLEPVRWNAVQGDVVAGQTLVVIGFGMNERGFPTTYGNLVTMIRGFQALGAEVLVITTSRPDSRFDNTLAAWRFTISETVRAAHDCGAAYCDVGEILSPENLCGLGLAEQQLCDATTTNHEGTTVQRAIGRQAARIFTF